MRSVQGCEDIVEIDIGQLLSLSWVCRTCAKAYHTHELKDTRLYAATTNSVSALTSLTLLVPLVQKRVVKQFSWASKRVCSTTTLPIVSVSVEKNFFYAGQNWL